MPRRQEFNIHFPTFAYFYTEIILRLYFCSDGQEDHKRSKNVTFHKLGIGGRNEDIGKLNNTKLRTLGTIRSMLGHEEVSPYLYILTSMNVKRSINLQVRINRIHFLSVCFLQYLFSYLVNKIGFLNCLRLFS